MLHAGNHHAEIDDGDMSWPNDDPRPPRDRPRRISDPPPSDEDGPDESTLTEQVRELRGVVDRLLELMMTTTLRVKSTTTLAIAWRLGWRAHADYQNSLASGGHPTPPTNPFEEDPT